VLPSLHFDGKVITSDEIERIDKEVLKFERTGAVSDPMRELIEDLWPELVQRSRYCHTSHIAHLHPNNRHWAEILASFFRRLLARTASGHAAAAPPRRDYELAR
jgi:hypothetical protein